MTPEQFLAQIAKQPPAAAYLFLGQEAYQRRTCKQALVDHVLPVDARAEGLAQFDLEDTSLPEVLDDARSLSLFARQRLVLISSAEAALPKRLSGPIDSTDGSENPVESELAAYLKAPTPGTVLVFECSRYDFSGEDRAKLERVQKFYSAVPMIVEFHQFTPESIRFLAQQLAKEHQLKLGGAELAALIDTAGSGADRIAAEIEKLALFVGHERAVTMDDLRTLVPNAAQTTIFALVHALARRDRSAALNSLDILIREGEYLPLALTFLSTQFRLALAAKETSISSAYHAQNFFAKLGIRVWRDRAEQVLATANAFTREHLVKAIALIYETDKKFREGYRDDRIVMEGLVLALTT